MRPFNLATLLFAGLTLAVGLDRRAASTYCYRDNCLRAVAQKPGHPIVASNDCRSILAGPTTPPVTIPTYATACSGFVRYSSACSCLGVTGSNLTLPVTTSSTDATTTASTGFYSTSIAKPDNLTSILSSAASSIKPILSTSPPFTNSTIVATSNPSSSSDYVLSNTTVPYSTKSAISPPFTNSTIISITASLISSSYLLTNSTTPTSISSSTSSSLPPIVTTPSLSTNSKTSSTSYAAPTCTNLLSDPLNCGTCGTVCSSGVCENGVCTSSQCTAQKCGGFTNCNSNTNCFCFSSTHGTNGFCGSNAVCSALTACASDEQCNVIGSTGNICAIQTCCPRKSNEKPGVCLQGKCGNPSAKLMMLAKASMLEGLTAAF